jgi:hypothetical protein
VEERNEWKRGMKSGKIDEESKSRREE